MEDGCAGIVAPQQMFHALHHAARIAARDDEDAGAGEPFQRLAEPAQRQRVAAAERIQRIHQHDVDTAANPCVLKAVVQQHDVHAKFDFELSS